MQKTGRYQYRKALAENRQHWPDALKTALDRIQARGISLEQVALDLGYGYAAVNSWHRKIRVPKLPTIKFIESKYKVKII